MRVYDIQDLRHTARRALDAGAVMARRSTVEWNVSSNCSNPQQRTMQGRHARKARLGWKHDADNLGRTDTRNVETQLKRERNQVVSGVSNNPLWIDITARCRRCENCLRSRAAMWRQRAATEIRFAGRTWLGTITLSAESHFMMMCRASDRLRKSAVQWRKLSEAEQLAERHRECSRELTLWLKRVREESGVALRYLLVMEKHKSGLPHYHVLIHEGAQPVVKRVLQSQWHLGFTNFKLVEAEATSHAKAAWYVSKYLTKSIEARVRASVRYGNTP